MRSRRDKTRQVYSSISKTIYGMIKDKNEGNNEQKFNSVQ